MTLELIGRCARGEPAAWEAFLRLHDATIAGAARHTLHRVLGSAPDADVENVQQGVLLSLLQNGGRKLLTYEGRSDLGAWLRTVTTRFALNYVRAEKTGGTLRFRPLQESPKMVGPGLEPDEVEQLLHALKPVEKVVVKMFVLDRHPYESIAAALGISVGTVASHLHRARRKLKEIAASSGAARVSSGCDVPLGREAGAPGVRDPIPGRA